MLRVLVALFALLRLLAVEGAVTYTLLARQSEFCKQFFARFKLWSSFPLTRQAQLVSGVFEDNATDIDFDYRYRYHRYVCQPSIVPLGKIVHWKLETGGALKFWYLRVRIEGRFPNCKQKLVITEIHNDRHVDDHDTSPIEHVYDCNTALPTILPAIYRRLEFRLDGDPDPAAQAAVTISISKYVRFSHNATSQERRYRCMNAQDLYFCNISEVCIPALSECDGNDDCFDDGSDELQCSDNANHTHNDTHSNIHGSWMTNLPWIALGTLPIVLVFALARICAQKRPLDFGEDYKMGFNTDDEEEGEEGAAGAAGMSATRSERSVSPDDAASARSGCPEDYNDEGYSLPRHKKTMSASSDYLPANFAELTASPANRTRRPENERSGPQVHFGPSSPAKRLDSPGQQQPSAPPQQQVVAVQINNPVYGNNVYVDVPSHAALIRENEYTAPVKTVVAPSTKGPSRNGQEEYTPLLPPLPPGAEAQPGEATGVAFPPSYGAGASEASGPHLSSGGSDDYEDEPPPYDDLMIPPPPATQSAKTSGDGERPEMLHLKPLLRSGGATAAGGATSPKAATPPAPNGSASAAPQRSNRDSDYDKNYIVV